MIESILIWNNANELIPEEDKEVLVYCLSGYTGVGMLGRVYPLVYNNLEKKYERSKFKIIEWGIEENGEYWHKLEDVIYWAEIPKPIINK